jgi:hypothetical protein
MMLSAATFKMIFSLTKAGIINFFRLDTDTDYRNTILLSSLGRSGSTLVSNIVNYKNDYRIIFEPFKQEKVKLAAEFIYPTYLDLNDTNENISVSMHKILTGRVRSWWTDKPNEKIITTKRLIKDIYTNLMLGWIKKYYPEIPIILLIRNPFATIESWRRSGWGDLNPKERTMKQRSLLEPLLPENVFYNYEKATSPLINHFYNWAINYYIPLRFFSENEIFVTYYENYLVHPEIEVKKLFSYLNKPFNEKAIDKLKEFSFTTRKDSPLRKGENILLSWRKKYSEEEMNACMDVLSQFGLDTLYDYYGSGLPLISFEYIK